MWYENIYFQVIFLIVIGSLMIVIGHYLNEPSLRVNGGIISIGFSGFRAIYYAATKDFG